MTISQTTMQRSRHCSPELPKRDWDRFAHIREIYHQRANPRTSPLAFVLVRQA